jgi:hypothetical protein
LLLFLFLLLLLKQVVLIWLQPNFQILNKYDVRVCVGFLWREVVDRNLYVCDCAMKSCDCLSVYVPVTISRRTQLNALTLQGTPHS